jgi:hypothetical protein
MAKSFFEEPNTEAWKKLSPKDALFRFIEYLEEIALDALSDEALGQEQKEALTGAREGLRSALELLNASMEPQTNITYTALHWLLGHEFVIAQHEGFLDKRAREVFDKVRARKANDGKIAKAGLQALDDAIVAEADSLGKTLMRSIEFARGLRPGVRERLGLPRNGEGRPTDAAIKYAISKRIKPAKTG